MRLEGVDDEFVAFCVAIRPRLVGALGLQCGHAVGEELVQETFVRTWERWPEVRRADNPEAWAFRVGFNLANSWIRRRSAARRAHRYEPREQIDPGDPSSSVAVRSAVAALPPRQRAVIVLRYFADLPVAEVAVIVGCAPGTVKSLTHNALALLRDRIALDGNDDGEEIEYV
jgi:RNA polymerase sigma-70 factor (sigma-E family)